jgi:hypothetical protein
LGCVYIQLICREFERRGVLVVTSKSYRGKCLGNQNTERSWRKLIEITV